MTTKETLKIFALWVLGIVLVQGLIDLSFSLALNAIDPSLLDFDDKVVQAKVEDHSAIGFALLGLGLVAPLIETIIFQYLLMRWLGRLSPNPVWIVGASSLCFALSHPYSLVYFLNTFVAGLLYHSAYYHLRERHSERLAFACSFVAHGLHNALVVLGRF